MSAIVDVCMHFLAICNCLMLQTTAHGTSTWRSTSVGPMLSLPRITSPPNVGLVRRACTACLPCTRMQDSWPCAFITACSSLQITTRTCYCLSHTHTITLCNNLLAATLRVVGRPRAAARTCSLQPIDVLLTRSFVLFALGVRAAVRPYQGMPRLRLQEGAMCVSTIWCCINLTF